MKKISILFLSLFLLSCTVVFGQDGEDHSSVSTISLAVVMPAEIKDLTDAQVSILEDRIKNIVSINGLSAEGGLDGFLIYPKFDINSKKTVTLTLGNMTVVQCTLSLFVRQYIPNSTSNIVFSSYTRDIAGNGETESEAINNALTQVRPGDEAFQTFLAKARTRIVTYYVQNCDRIMNEAQHAADLQNYDKAFALLLSIPKEATQCYGQVQQESVAIYLKKQRQDCNRYIVEAKTFAAAHNYDSALAILRKVDPEGVCKDDLAALITNIVSRVDENEKKNWDLLIQQMHDSVELQKARIEAESELAKSYLQGAGRQNYVVNGNGPNAPIQVDRTNQPGNGYSPGQSPSQNPGPGGSSNGTVPDNQASTQLLASTTLQPEFLFGNAIYPSFIISRASFVDPDAMKKYGDIYSGIGMTISNPSMSGTINYQIDPVEDKYFGTVSGSIDVRQGQTIVYYPSIPWKYEALKGIQQSTPLSIRFRLMDNAGHVKEQIVKISVRSIEDCITYWKIDGKLQLTPTLAAYVDEENPLIEKLLAVGIEKKWVDAWTGYQEGEEGLIKQIGAVWKILVSKNIHYSDIAGATTDTHTTYYSQLVRPFCESITNKQANCVDGTVVFASILKRIHIRPVLVLVPGHCFLAFHPTETDTDKYIFLETTMLGDVGSEAGDAAVEHHYLDAIKKAGEEFDKADKTQTNLIDIESFRKMNITAINLSNIGCN
jgi:hypothetical protein